MSQSDLCPCIACALRELLSRTQPELVYLYHHRVSHSGQTAGFKFCVVTCAGHPCQLEQQLYEAIHSPVSFSLLVYTPQEWAVLSHCRGSFAQKIKTSGQQIYPPSSCSPFIN